MKKIIPIILVILLLAVGVRLVKVRKEAMQNAPRAIPVTYTVRTVIPQTRTISQSATYLAKLESATQSAISTKLSGQIVDLPVSESQAVKKGDLLVQIDDREIQARLAAAQKQRRYSMDQHQRNQALFDAGGLPQEKLEVSAVALANANAAVQGLEAQLEYSRITAPFDGTVGTLFQRAGDLAAPGRPILSLHSTPQKLTFTFAANSAGIQKGQTVLWQNKPVGTIAKLYADAQGGLTVAEVALEQKINQPSGSYLTVQAITKTVSGCAIPLQSLLHQQQKTHVMQLQKENHFQPLEVTILAQDADFAVVEPELSQPVAVAAEAKLALLPTARGIRVITGDSNE